MIDTPEQRRMKINDSRKLAASDWAGSAQFDREEDHWPHKFADNYLDFAAGEMRAWLHSLGMRWFPVVGWAERGGGFAHDLALEVAKEKFAATAVILVHGLEDDLVTEESKKRQEELLLELGKPLNLLTFSGGHELDPEMVERIINQGF